jgi:hypothetical protein
MRTSNADGKNQYGNKRRISMAGKFGKEAKEAKKQKISETRAALLARKNYSLLDWDELQQVEAAIEHARKTLKNRRKKELEAQIENARRELDKLDGNKS